MTPSLSSSTIPGEPTDPLDEGAPIRSLEADTEKALVRIALALGAAELGGELSEGEQELVDRAAELTPPSARVLDSVHDSLVKGGDPLGAMFCSLRSATQRRSRGAFFTPPSLVGPMVEWVLRRDPDRVVDPGCGSGRFAAAVIRCERDSPVVAIDVDPLATLLTRASLAALGAKHARVLHCDYTAMDLPAAPGRTAFVGNPPYIRHHDLATDSKARARKAAKRLGKTISGLAGLHAHFFLATAIHGRPGDIGCFVTSAEWLDVNYGAIVRELLTDELGLVSLHVLDPEAVPFEDAMTTAAITTFELGSARRWVLTGRAASLDLLGSLDEGVVADRELFAHAQRWTALLRAEPGVDHAADAVPLSAVARVHRGLVTGANDFFILTREQARLFGIEQWCRPAITSAKEILAAGGVLRDGPKRKLLLDVPRAVDRNAHPPLDAYLAQGETSPSGGRAICARYIPSHRRPWWYLGPSASPPIVATYMARQAPVFALNPDHLPLVNIGHGIYPTTEFPEHRLTWLVDQLNRLRQSFRGSGRTYHGGLEKFEPAEMEALLLPWTAV